MGESLLFGSGSPAVQVNVRLFALARERAGRASVALELPDSGTVADLKSALAEILPVLAPLLANLRIAVDAEYVVDDRPIPPGAEVAVIPPVSGGQFQPSPSRSR
jgi:molybdopterin converting factor subunit 1